MSMRWYIFTPIRISRKRSRIHQGAGGAACLSGKFEEILVPTEHIVEIRRGRKINSERKFFPGYVLVKCDLSTMSTILIKNTPKVTGFLGATKSRCRFPIARRSASRVRSPRVSPAQIVDHL